MRALALVAALALAGCRLWPANGYAVDVTVVAAPGLPSATVDAIRALAESVRGAEVYDQRFTVTTQLRDGGARFIYRPAVSGGRLSFTSDGLDGNGVPIAQGMGVVTLARGATVPLTVELAPYSTLPVADDMSPPADLAPAPPDFGLSDELLCELSCAALIGCGVQNEQAQCLGVCLQGLGSPVFRTCARTAGGDCNALAMCEHKQLAAVLCTAGPSMGIPIGGVSCHDTAACEASCNLKPNGATILSCTCDCRSELSPAQALNHLIDLACVNYHCSSLCSLTSTSFDGTKCNTCGMMYCGNGACMSH
jgi:hypothetical protein